MRFRYFIWVSLLISSCTNENSNKNSGKLIFEKNCVTCHGLKGNLQVSGASDLTASQLSKEQMIEVIKDGRNTMSPYKGTLSASEINAVAKHVIDLRAKK